MLLLLSLARLTYDDDDDDGGNDGEGYGARWQYCTVCVLLSLLFIDTIVFVCKFGHDCCVFARHTCASKYTGSAAMFSLKIVRKC